MTSDAQIAHNSSRNVPTSSGMVYGVGCNTSFRLPACLMRIKMFIYMTNLS